MSSEVSPAFALMPLPSTSQQLDVSEVTEARLHGAQAEAPASAGSRFNDFYGQHAQFVARSLCRLGIRDELLDDALQEVFLIVYRKLPELDAAEHEKTWVFRITMNVAANLRRQTQRWHRKLGGGTAALPEGSTSEEEQLSRLLHDEKRALLYRVLDGLDEDKRMVFVLHELEQLGVPEVAAALGLNLNTAYSRLRAARAAFERGVAEHAPDDGREP
jgi:RNA polymerase sigma-70 factor (ECF subfamily)